jgi:hypothetical protein
LNELIRQATPLALAAAFSVLGVIAALIGEAGTLLAEANPDKRRARAKEHFKSSVPPALCVAAFSYDIWALTTMFTSDTTTLTFYNLKGKSDAVTLLLLLHFSLYMFVLVWSGLVRGRADASSEIRYGLEYLCAVVAILLCIGFQVYPA